MIPRRLLSKVAALALWGMSALAFRPRLSFHGRQGPMKSSPSPRLLGISEWRDQALTSSSYTTMSTPSNSRSADIVRPIPIYLVDSNQVILQGETLYLQFTRDDDVRLFQLALDCHQGVFALGYVSSQDDILYDKVSLVEIKDYNMMGDEFGIFLSVQVVGVAMILETQVRPASCTSSTSSDLGLDDHEDKQPVVALCAEIFNREEQITLAKANELGKEVEVLIAKVCNAENESRLLVGDDQDRWDRYREAYVQALECDTQGYRYSQEDSDECPLASGDKEKWSYLYTWSELNAISWAAFCTSACLKNDSTYRLAALDNDSMSNRLRLAAYWLSDVLQDVQQEAV